MPTSSKERASAVPAFSKERANAVPTSSKGPASAAPAFSKERGRRWEERVALYARSVAGQAAASCKSARCRFGQSPSEDDTRGWR